jgi:hypothetical protein
MLDAAPGGRTEPGRPARAWWIVAVAGFVLSFFVAATLFTLWRTVLEVQWYRSSLDHSHAYDRLYDEVLTDKDVARDTRHLLAGLPIDHSLVAANARLVLPPETLREVVNRTLDSMVGYLRAERDTFDPTYALEPVFDNIRKLADQYLADGVTNLRPLQADSVDAFATNLVQFANDLGAGRRPRSLPTVPFTADQVGQLTDVLLGPIPVADREGVRLATTNALAAGDISTALATVAPLYGADNTHRAIVELRQDAHGTHFRVDENFSGVDDTIIVIDLSRIRFLTGTVLPVAIIGSALLAVGCLVATGELARRSGRRPAVVCAVTVIAAGVGLLLVYFVARFATGDPLHQVFGNSSVAPALGALLGDIATNMFDDLDRTLVNTLTLPLLAAGMVLLWIVGIPWLQTRLRGVRRRTVISVTAVASVVVVIGAAVVVVPDAVRDEPRRCNGHAELCDRPYDDVVYAESHNSMSVSDLGWLGANQDVPMVDQLDAGVRALHIDTRYWETPEVTAKFAASLPPQQAAVVLAAAAGVNPVRPGVWLCHALCRLGSLKFSTALRQIKGWVRDHPDDVLTLDIENRVSAKDTVAVFRKSGLLPYLYTPGDPKAPWPTLGEMLDAGKRVVVFAERQGGEAPWYGRLFDYAMETPYTFTKASEFSCRRGRGGTGKRLFVMSHFITRAAPSRTDAAVVNTRASIVDRARRCAERRGRLPNFISVDFATLGDVNGAVDTLNGVRPGS